VVRSQATSLDRPSSVQLGHPSGSGVEYLHRDPASRRRHEEGSLRSETVKYGRESQGTRTRERLRWQGPAPYTKDRPVVSSERAPHKNRIVLPNSNKHLVMSPRWGSTPRLTDWLTVSRYVPLTLTVQLAISRNHTKSWKCKCSQHWTRRTPTQ
jgi:hypothetical protein